MRARAACRWRPRSSRSRRGPRARATANSCARLADLDLADQVAPIQLAIRLLIPEGSLLLELPEVRRDGRAVRSRAACAIPGSNRDPALDALCAAIQETDQARRAPAARRGRRSSGRSGTWPEAGEFPDLPLAGARDDPVSDRALVLLSGAHGRAVSSCVISVELQCMIWSGTSGLRRAGRWKPRSGSASQSNHRATAQHWSLKERS